jgi:hypothetical protein
MVFGAAHTAAGGMMEMPGASCAEQPSPRINTYNNNIIEKIPILSKKNLTKHKIQSISSIK